jgi:menaquinone-dependent protoporphyrinogen IX oxidase
MDKIAVIYKSKYGSTERYASWIAQETGADLYKTSEITPAKMKKYDVLVFGGGLYEVNILGISLLKNNYEKIKDKRIVVFSVGSSPESQKAISSVMDKNFSPEIQHAIRFFHLRGALNYDKMSPKHKFMMRMLKRMLDAKKPEDLDADERGILETFGQNTDFTNKDSIRPIVDYIKQD